MIRKESIAVINDSLSPPLSDVVLSAVAAHVESHLRSVLRTAEKFSRHSFQSLLLPDHLNSALRVMGQPPVYGHAQGVLGPGGGGGVGGEAVWKDAGGGVFYAEDETLDFASVLSASLPPPPAAASLSVHWLAVEGVQPAVPQNPKAAQHDASIPPAETKQIVVPLPPPTAGAAAADEQPAIAVSSAERLQAPKLRLLSARVLSREQEMYLEKVTAAIKGSNPLLAEAALRSLSQDAGLQQLVPFLVHFVAEEVAHSLRSLPRLHAALQTVAAMLSSEQLYLEPYLHQLLPSLLTCMLSRHLCAEPQEDHWTLRNQAAALVALVCHRYGAIYVSLRPRITRTLLGAWLDVSRALTSHYGAIIGITSLGHQAIRSCILPHVAAYVTLIEPVLRDDVNLVRRQEASNVYHALLAAVGSYVRTELLSPDVSALLKRERQQRDLAQEDRLQRTEAEAERERAATTAKDSTQREEKKKGKREAALALRQQLSGRKRSRTTAAAAASETKDAADDEKMEVEEQQSSPSVSASASAAQDGSSVLFPVTDGAELSELLELFGDALLPYIESAVVQLEEPALPAADSHSLHAATFL